jgi:hypothetical protein
MVNEERDNGKFPSNLEQNGGVGKRERKEGSIVPFWTVGGIGESSESMLRVP